MKIISLNLKKFLAIQREGNGKKMNKSYISFMQLKKLPTIPPYHHTTYVCHPIPLVLAVMVYN
jgi:hypothetical protein